MRRVKFGDGGIEPGCRDVALCVSIADPADSAGHNESKVPRIPTHAEVQADPDVLRAFNAAVVEEFRSNRGRVGGPFADSDVVLLTMTGAKSGQRRQTPLEYFTVDGRILIVGTRGGAPQNPAGCIIFAPIPRRMLRLVRIPMMLKLKRSQARSATTCTRRWFDSVPA
jgi:hypothetical protein